MSQNVQPKVNFNSVSEDELINKLQISPRLARRIIALRPYRTFEQLNQVWGIDPQTLTKIEALFEIEQAKPAIQATSPTEKHQEIPLPAQSVKPFTEMLLMPLPDYLTEPDVVPEPMPEKVEQAPVPFPEKIAPPSPSFWKSSTLIILILLVAAVFRFTGLNWDNGYHQHPDERYLTMVAESIRGVDSIKAYFDTSTSTLNPLNHGSYTYGMFPLFMTRMVAEWVNMTSYDSITLVGRFMSGLFDLAAIWMLYLLAKRLYNQKVGLIAAALASVAVLPIQLSHFFAVDSFSTVFVIASFYFLILAVPLDIPDARTSLKNFQYFALFGFTVGLAGACKINTLPVLGLIFLAAMIYLFIIRKEKAFPRSLGKILLGLFLAVLFAFLAFRVFQPYAFAGPSFFDFAINQRWYDVIKEVTNQVAGNSEWPPNHHWTNRPVQYAWVNMVLWGMGIPLGLAAWFGWGWAGVRIWKGDWRKHLFPFVWVLAYFIWQNVQFWRYMRYFVPIYPFLILFAAWALAELITKYQVYRQRINSIGKNLSLQFSQLKVNWKGLASIVLLAIVLLGTFSYAFAFTRIYARPHTRVQASRWILSNIEGPLNVKMDTAAGRQSYPIPVYNNRVVEPNQIAMMDLKIKYSGTTSTITAPQVKRLAGSLYFRISRDELGEDRVTEGRMVFADHDQAATSTTNFGDLTLDAGQTYYLYYRLTNSNVLSFSDLNLRNENQDDPRLFLDVTVDYQAPGVLEQTIQFTTDQPLRINRLEINNFQQEFIPSNSILRVSILRDRDEQNPLAVSENTIDFNDPGAIVQTSFDFPSIQLNAGMSYQVKYELVGGSLIQLLSENFALETSWDDALPLSVDKTDALGGIYSPLNLELYEADTNEKREKMIQILEDTQYLVIPSNRAYDAMPRLELRYPLTLRYYQLLFDCECSSDQLEKRAYSLDPPFKSPLGFDLVATFVSNPNLGPFQINDQNADESFTVYDHPKVFVFKKSSDFSIENVKTALNQVNLDNVIFQAPIDYTKAPTALTLTDERLAAQTAAGTWSEMFNRLSLINQNQVLATIAWYFLIWLLGVIIFPLGFKIFPGLADRGYPLFRMAALLILTWVPWLLGSLTILPFTRLTIILALLLILGINLWIYFQNRKPIWEFIRANIRHIVAVEFIFAILFLFSLSIRIGNPDLWHPWLGGEKPMDFAFFNAVIKSVYFPPQNPWFSEHYINYYYYGYVVAAIPTKLLGIMPSIAFNLVLPGWFAMTGIGVFSAASNLYRGFNRNQDTPLITPPAKKKIFALSSHTRATYFIGVLAIAAVLFFGNFYEVKILWKNLPLVSNIVQDSENTNKLDAVISGAGRVLSGEVELPGDKGQWYFAASRPILHDGPDTPIAEFPYFSFLYADLHPHLLAMPFYALALAWCLSIILDPIVNKKRIQQILTIVFGALFIGSFRAIHTWDFPAFMGLGILALVWSVLKTNQIDLKKKIQTCILYAASFVFLAMLFYMPFTNSFKTEYVGVEIWKGLRTPLKDYFVVYGLSLFVMFTLLIFELKPDYQKVKSEWFDHKSLKTLIPVSVLTVLLVAMSLLWKNDYQVLAFGLPLLCLWIYIIFFKKSVSEFHRLIWSLFAVGYGLTYLVEVVVLKGDVGRSNMVFRMYLEAWFILGIALSVAIVEILKKNKLWHKAGRISWIVGLQILILLALVYPIVATERKINDRWPGIQNPPKSLDGSLFMLGDRLTDPNLLPAIYSDEGRELDLSMDYDGIQFLQDHVTGSPVIVEGHTTEYRWGGRYAIHTGLPTVIGWNWHTRQHNSLLDASVVEKRIQQVIDFYNTTDIVAANEFLKKYSVRYIIVSGLERAYYTVEGIDKFSEMTDQGIIRLVYGSGSAEQATIYEVIEN